MADRRRPALHHGVFETLLAIDGRPVELDAHLARLESSLRELFPDRQPPDLAGTIHARALGLGPLCSVRASVEPANGILLTKVSGTSLATPIGFPAKIAQGATRAIGLRSLVVAGGLGAHKWVDRGLLDEAQADLPTDTLPLIIDTDGAALEASRATVFAVRDGALFTPPLDGRILPGVTRMRVLEIAAGAGIETHESALDRSDLLTADEIFLTGSVRGIEPVASLDGEGLAAPGPLAAELAEALQRAWLGAPVS